MDGLFFFGMQPFPQTLFTVLCAVDGVRQKLVALVFYFRYSILDRYFRWVDAPFISNQDSPILLLINLLLLTVTLSFFAFVPSFWSVFQASNMEFIYKIQ